MRSVKKVLAFCVAMLLILGACSAQESSEDGAVALAGDSGGPVTTVADSGSEEERAEETESTAGEASLGDGGVEPVALPIDFGRDIIFTADLVVAVSDVGLAGTEATRTVQSLGGFLFGQRTSGGPDPTSELTFKIAPERFQTALDELGSIGEIRTQSVDASDVTERIVDLESRIATSTASVERLRALLGEATDIKSIVELESELVARETELETLRGSLRTLEDQVALATIVLSLTEAEANPGLAVAMTAYPSHDDGVACPGSSSLEVETGSQATVCYEVVNVGDTWLAGFEMRDPVLDVELKDLIVVFGDPSAALEPGDSIWLAAQVSPERDLRTKSTFTAQAVNEDGQPLSERSVSQTESFFVDAVEVEGIASFSDGLAASWELLVRLGQVLVLALGAVLPFIWIPIGVALLFRYRRGPSVDARMEADGTRL